MCINKYTMYVGIHFNIINNKKNVCNMLVIFLLLFILGLYWIYNSYE